MSDPVPIASRTRWLPAALLMGVALAAYSNSFGAAFSHDSVALVLDDARVHEFSWDNIQAVFGGPYWPPQGDPNLYRPLPKLIWMALFGLFGFGANPAPYHCLNFALHAANALLLFGLLRRIIGREWLAFFGAALFALHPINTEAVTNIAGLPDLLAATIILAALTLHARSDRWTGVRALTADGALLAAAVACLTAKESGIVLVPLLILYDVAFRSGSLFRRLRMRAYAAAAVGAALELLIRHFVLAAGRPPDIPFLDNPLTGASFLDARLTASGVVWRYIGLLLFPWRLSADYSYNQIPILGVWAGIAAAAALGLVCVLLLVALRRNPAIFFFGAWFFVTLFPVSNVALLIGSIMAERFLYLPSAGFAACVAIAAYSLSKSAPAGWQWRTRTAVLCALAALFALRTFVRNRDWQDDRALWSSAAAASPNSFRPYWVLGNLLGRDPGSWTEAAADYQKAIDILQGLPPERKRSVLYSSLAGIWLRRADADVRNGGSDAATEYRMALLFYRDAETVDAAHTNSVLAELRRKGRANFPIPDPGDWNLYAGESAAFEGLGRLTEAEHALSRAIHIDFTDDRLFSRMAALQNRIGNRSSALQWAAQALLIGKSASELESFHTLFAAENPGACEPVSTLIGRVNFDCVPAKAVACEAEATLLKRFVDTGHGDHVVLYRRSSVTGDHCAIQ